MHQSARNGRVHRGALTTNIIGNMGHDPYGRVRQESTTTHMVA